MTQPHTDRKHSKLGPSAAHRWLHCTGSVAMTRNIENKSTVFALEGTAAHEFNEFILATGRDPQDWLGGVVDLESANPGSKFIPDAAELDDRERYFAIDAEMVEGAELTIETINEYYKPEEGDILLLETRLDMSWIHPALFGTGDMLIYKPKTKHLIVLDYKYGQGVAVDVEDNEQVLTYSVGAVRLFVKEGVDKVTTVIVQPRAFHVDGPVRTEEVDILDLDIFEATLREKAAETDSAEPHLVAGEQCKFCPASHACEEFRDFVADAVSIHPIDLDSDPITENDLPKLTDLTPDRLGKLVVAAHLIGTWCKRVLQFAQSEALDGRVPDGCKMVEKRAYRKFTAAPDDVIGVLDLEGFGEDDYLTEPKLRSVAQIEKLVGKKAFGVIFDGFFKKESSGFTLVSEDDKRKAAKVDKSDAFGEVDDD